MLALRITDHPDNIAATQLNYRSQPMDKWECIVCGFIYEEEKGLPGEGIEPGTRWEEIPENWKCPECGVSKSDFEMVRL